MSEKLRILFLDTKASNPNHYIYLSIAAAFRRHPDVEDLTCADYGNALALAKERKSNFFVAYDGENLNTEICRRLRGRCGFGALWVTDDPYELRYNVQSADAFDLIFTNDRAAACEYGPKGRFLAFAADPATHSLPVRDEGDPALRYDVFFAGVAWPNRVRLLRSLVRDLPEVKFKIALVGNEHLPEFALPLEPSSYTFRTSPRDFARLANASRITLGLHRDFSASIGANSLTASPPPRLFEVALAGSVQLISDEMRDVTDFFKPGREVVTYPGYHDCVEAVRFLLSDGARRSKMARAAQDRALHHHTFDNRVSELLAACEAARRAAAPKSQNARERARVLLVAHNVLGAQPHGGIEVYIDRLRRWLSRDFEVLTFSYARGQEDNTFVLLDSRGEQIDRVVFDGAWQRFSLSNQVKEAYFADLLVRHEIELIHYHHLIGHPLSLPIIGRALGLPSVWTLHDYDGVCDSFNLLDYNQHYCEIDRKSEGVCDFCTQRRFGLPIGAQRARRALIAHSLEAVDRICVNSEVTRTMYARFYPEIMDGPRIVTLPVPMPESEAWGANESDRSERFTDGADISLDLVVLGNFTIEKGASVILDAAQALVDERVRFRIHGRIDPRLEGRLASLRLPNVDNCGPYGPADLPAILRRADCTLHLSIWPETYCIALSEAWAHGCVPIVADIGALGERVTDRVNGFKVLPNDPGDLVRVIREVIASRALLGEIAGRIDARLWPAARDHVRTMAAMYRDLLDDYALDVRSSDEGVRRTKLSLFECGITLSDRALELGNDRGEAHVVLSAKQTPFDRTGELRRKFERVDASPLLDTQPRLHGHLDQVDESSADATESIVKDEEQVILLRGWRVDRNVAAALGRIHVLLVNVREREAYSAECSSERRPDVAELYNSEALMHAGFSCNASLSGVRPGVYRIALEDSGRYSGFSGPAIHVQARVVNEDAFAGLEPGDTLLAATIDAVNGNVIAPDLGPIPVNGRLSLAASAQNGSANGDGVLWLVMESAVDGERRYARVPRADGDAGHDAYHAELDVHDVPAGVYRLSLARIEGSLISASEPLANVRLGEQP